MEVIRKDQNVTPACEECKQDLTIAIAFDLSDNHGLDCSSDMWVCHSCLLRALDLLETARLDKMEGR